MTFNEMLKYQQINLKEGEFIALRGYIPIDQDCTHASPRSIEIPVNFTFALGLE
jgi:hypothetical protein